MIPIIVLAAGQSKRFGRNKLLEKVNGCTLIEKVVRSALSSRADEVIVVLGFEAQKVMDALKNLNCRFVINEEYYLGQSSSVKAGVKAVAEYAKAVLILPGDMPLITHKSINMVIEEYHKSRNPIVVASYMGRLGHPILFDKSLFNEILAINEEGMGLKAVVRRYKNQIKKVDINSIEVLVDVDVPEDLERMRSQIRDEIQTNAR